MSRKHQPYAQICRTSRRGRDIWRTWRYLQRSHWWLLVVPLVLTACSHPLGPVTVHDPVVVKQAVPIACSPPARLTSGAELPTVTFREPFPSGKCPAGADCDISSGLYPADELALMRRDATLRQRLKAWAEWGGCQ